MTSLAFEMAVYRAYRSRGMKSAKELSDADFKQIALSIRSRVEIARDGAKVGISVVSVALIPGRKVPLPIYEDRRAKCLSRRCGRAEISREGNPVCMVCGCSGAMMNAALWDAAETCRLPPGKRLWEAYGTDDTGNPSSLPVRGPGDPELRG